MPGRAPSVFAFIILFACNIIAFDILQDNRSLGRWVQLLHSPDLSARMEAALALGRLGPAAKAAVPALVDCLNDKDAAVRAVAAEALGKIGPGASDATQALIRLLSDSVPGVRASAATALGAVAPADPAAADSLRKAAEDSNAEVRANASRALQSMAKSGSKLQSAALQSASTLSDLERWTRLLESADKAARLEACVRIGNLGPAARSSVSQLVRMLNDPEAIVRASAADALGKIGAAAASAAPALRQALADPEQLVKTEASNALSRITGATQAVRVADAASSRLQTVQKPVTGDSFSTLPARFERLPPPKPGPRAREAEPTQPEFSGKSLGEWMQLLGNRDAEVRLQAADALGRIGPAAEPAVGPLNFARIDADPRVRQRAAWALCRILGIPLGARASDTPKTKPKTALQGIGSRVFFFRAFQEATESGVKPSREIRQFRENNALYLGSDLYLNYLDLAEVQRYREDAKKRNVPGLDKSYQEILRFDPQAKEARERFQFVKTYKHDYVVRITCAGQTSYWYKRFSESNPSPMIDGARTHGGSQFLGIRPGNYSAQVTVFAAEGFRLDFEIAFRVDSPPDPAPDRVAALASIAGPQDIARQDRRRVDTPQPKLKGDNAIRARRALDVAKAVQQVAWDLALYHAASRAELAPYLADAVAMYRRALQLDPSVLARGEDVLGFLTLCARLGGSEAFVQARKAALILEAGALTVQGSSEQEVGIAAYNAFSAYSILSQMAIALRNDVELCRDYRRHMLRYLGPARHPYGAALDKDDIASEDNWPQPDWYPESQDELQPPRPPEEDDQELLAMAGWRPSTKAAQPAEEDAGVEKDPIRFELTGDQLSLLEEKLREIDNERADAERQMDRMGERRLRAKEQTVLSLEKLEMIRIALIRLQSQLDYFQAVLSWTPEQKGEDPVFQAFYSLMNSDSVIRRDLAGDREAMRHTIQDVLDKLQNKQIALEQERDRTIQDVLLEYKAIAVDLRADSAKSIWPSVRARAEAAIQDTENTAALIEVELYLEAGRDKEFREKARACIASGKWEYEIRLLEAKYFLSKGQRGLALSAARNALAVGRDGEGEHEDQELETLPDGTRRRKPPTPAQHAIRGIEMDLLKLIDGKITSEAHAFQKRLSEELSKHGDAGFFSFIGDALTIGETGALSAIGNRLAVLDYFTSTIPDHEDIDGGKQEHQAREIGIVLDDATRAHIGLAMIMRFREKGLSLTTIRNMTHDDFKETVLTELGKTGDHWKSITDQQIVKMRAAMMLAFENRDVKKMVEWKNQPLDLETGKEYLDCEAYRASFLDKLADGKLEVADVAEVLEDSASAKNLLLILGPSAQVSAAWRGTTFMQWANPTARAIDAGKTISLKEAFVSAVRLPELAKALGQTELGQALMADFVKLDKSRFFLDRMLVDSAVQFDAATLAGMAAETVTNYLGGGKEAQRKAKEIAELLSQVITSYGVGDYDIAVKLARKSAVRPEQIRALATSLQQGLDRADEVAAAAAPYAKQLDEAVQELNAAGALSQNSRRMLQDNAGQLREQMARLAVKLADEESEAALAEFMRGKGILEGLMAASEGMPGQVKTIKSLLDDLAERIKDLRAAAQSRKATCESLARNLEDHAARMMNQTGKLPNADFRRPSILRMADRMVLADDLAGARRAYAEGIEVLEELGVTKRLDLEELRLRLQVVQERLNLQEHFKAMGLRHAAGAATIPDIAEEVEAIRKAGYTLQPVGSGISKPSWVMVNGRKVGVFKEKPGANTGGTPRYGWEAEELVPKLARELGIPAPAGIRTRMRFDPQGPEVEGVFIRYVEGKTLFDCSHAERIAMKKQIARDMVLRALVGDRDGHSLNYKLGPDGILRPLDRNFADFLDEEAFRALQGQSLSLDPARMEEQIAKIMRWRLRFPDTLLSNPNATAYHPMSELLPHFVYEDFAETIAKVKTWNRDFLAKLIGNAFGDDTERILDIMEVRIRVMEEAFKREFPSINDIIPPGPGEIAAAEAFDPEYELPLAA